MKKFLIEESKFFKKIIYFLKKLMSFILKVRSCIYACYQIYIIICFIICTLKHFNKFIVFEEFMFSKYILETFKGKAQSFYHPPIREAPPPDKKNKQRKRKRKNASSTSKNTVKKHHHTKSRFQP